MNVCLCDNIQARTFYYQLPEQNIQNIERSIFRNIGHQIDNEVRFQMLVCLSLLERVILTSQLHFKYNETRL